MVRKPAPSFEIPCNQKKGGKSVKTRYVVVIAKRFQVIALRT